MEIEWKITALWQVISDFQVSSQRHGEIGDWHSCWLVRCSLLLPSVAYIIHHNMKQSLLWSGFTEDWLQRAWYVRHCLDEDVDLMGPSDHIYHTSLALIVVKVWTSSEKLWNCWISQECLSVAQGSTKAWYQKYKLALSVDANRTRGPWNLTLLFTLSSTPLVERAWQRHLCWRNSITICCQPWSMCLKQGLQAWEW